MICTFCGQSLYATGSLGKDYLSP